MTKPFIEQLVSRMTLREKAAQLTQLTPLYFGLEDDIDVTGPLGDKAIRPEDVRHVGSVLGVYNADKFRRLQEKHLAENPYGIPLINMCDVTHGLRTIFPIPLAMGCSWDPDAVRESAAVAARESAYMGIHVTYSPMCDIVRDPRWGRVMESTGEDAYLSARLAERMVEGYQGDDPRAAGKLGACFKHLAGYGAVEGGREYNTVDLSRGALRDAHFPVYEAAARAGALMAMTSFNTIERVPATANRWLLQDVLRGEWTFGGAVVSDFNAVDELIEHGVAEDGEEAALKSLAAGMDIEMMSAHYLGSAEKLVADGRLDEKALDEAVVRVLELKDRLGLFDNPYKDCDPVRSAAANLSEEHRRVARDVARKSIVLLQNNDRALPLPKRGAIGLAGPYALSRKVLGGWWALGREEECVSLLEGIRNVAPELTVATAMTGELARTRDGGDAPDEVEEALVRLRDCETVIVAVGEHPEDTGEACSKTDLRLSPNQRKLIAALREAGKRVVALVFSGRPLELEPVCGWSDAVIQAWFLGNESGNALADVLFGDCNPSGRLSMSFPRSVGQIPVYYNHLNTGRPQKSETDREFVTGYLDSPNAPLFPFGYGLSYSEFHYAGLSVWQGNEGASRPVGHMEEGAGVSVGQREEHAGLAVGLGQENAGLSVGQVEEYMCRSVGQREEGAGVSVGWGNERAHFVVGQRHECAGLSVGQVEERPSLKVGQGYELLASVEVENRSDVDGVATVQWYVRDVSASVARPVKELRHFEKVSLKAGEKRVCYFPITKELLSFYAEGPERVFEPGLFTIMVGNHSASLIGKTVRISGV